MKKLILTQGKVALIDDEDEKKVAIYSWYASKVKTSKGEKYYAMRPNYFMGERIEALLHRYILNLKPKDTCRFIDGDSLNCQKKNLFATRRS